MITVFGATGYTGQKIAAVLAGQGLPFRIAGRSAARLEALSQSLASTHPEIAAPTWLVADADRPSTLPPLFANTRLLINCAGPYTDLGETVLAQAGISGVHYLDVTNELGFRFRMRSYHEMARRSDAALVPACGFEVALADCAAEVIARPLIDEHRPQPLDAVRVVYILSGKGTSMGTRRSAIRSLATSWIAYQDGGWHGAIPGGKVRYFAAPIERHALNFPSCEVVTVPAHLPVRDVSAWMSTTPGARFWAPLMVPLFARMARGIFGRGIFSRGIAALAGRGGLHDNQERQSDEFTIFVSASQGSTERWMTLQGQDVYGLTAQTIGYFAACMTSPGYTPSGVLAPAQAVDAGAFLTWAQTHCNLRREEGPAR